MLNSFFTTTLLNTYFFFASALDKLLPFSRELAKPFNWFLDQSLWLQLFIGFFGMIGFYILLRTFFKMIENFLSMFD